MFAASMSDSAFSDHALQRKRVPWTISGVMIIIVWHVSKRATKAFYQTANEKANMRLLCLPLAYESFLLWEVNVLYLP